MKSSGFLYVVIPSVSICAVLTLLDDGLAEDASKNSISLKEGAVGELEKKVLPLYPGVRTRRNDAREPYIVKVQELTRLPLADGAQRLVLVAHVTVPAAMIDHGYSELLIYEDAADQQPLIRDGLHRMATRHDPFLYGGSRSWIPS